MHKQSIPGHLSPFMEPVYNAKSLHRQIVNDRHQFYSKECSFCVEEMASNCAFIKFKLNHHMLLTTKLLIDVPSHNYVLLIVHV